MHFLLLFFPLILPAQPYKLDLKREAWIGGAGLVFLAADLGLSTALEPLRAQDIAALDPGAVWGPDRFALKRYSMAADLRSDVALVVSTAAAGVSGLLALEGKPFHTRGSGAGCALAGNQRPRHRRNPFLQGRHSPRPAVCLQLGRSPRAQTGKRRPQAPLSGIFPAAANTFFAAKVFLDYFPESPWKPMVWGLAAALPAWTSVERDRRQAFCERYTGRGTVLVRFAGG